MQSGSARVRAAALFTVTGAMWLVRALDSLLVGGFSAGGHGVVPRTWYGLEGIPAAPFIHENWPHLIANTIPLLILGALVLLRGVGEFTFVFITSAIVAGTGSWIFGASNSEHIGASGVVFGLFGYLVFRTAFDRRISSALITLVVAVIYGTSMADGLLPTDHISWTAHFFGFIGGFLAARLKYPARAARLVAVPANLPPLR
jgi:membrane associated rhomboid family serine protease